MAKLNYLMKLPFWERLDESERKLIQDNSIIKKYSKGQLVYNSGSECSGLTMVLNGELRISVMSEEGREITLYRLHENELCALSASCILSQITFDTQTTVAEDCMVLLINPYTFEKTNQSKYLCPLFYVRAFERKVFICNVDNANDCIQRL